jgi:uncharacterized damage-inducible protein DinB
MTVDHQFIEQNRQTRERLRQTVARLSDADLAVATPGGWTVADALAHLAFFDRRAFVLVAKWQRGEVAAPSAIDVDVINDAAYYLIRLLPPRAAAEEAVAAAEAIDRVLEEASDTVIARVLETQVPLPHRAALRTSHLDEIDALLPAT